MFDVDSALAEAQRQFHKSGYEGTKMSDVCEALGITQTSLYAVHKNKAELYGSVVDRYVNVTATFIGQALTTAEQNAILPIDFRNSTTIILTERQEP